MCVAENLKNREREVGQQVGEMAEETCQKSLQEEIRLYFRSEESQPALMVPGKNGVLDEPIIVLPVSSASRYMNIIYGI